MSQTTPNRSSAIGLIILAAGASTRMGMPKQLLAYQGETLLQTAVKTGLRSRCFPVAVVLGAYKELMRAELADFPVFIGENADWEEGMASSIRVGMETLREVQPSLEAVIIMLCDQPFVSATLLNELMEAFNRTQAPVVASMYEDTVGVPALFSHTLFGELLALQGIEGARKLIGAYMPQVLRVPFPLGNIDIDTPEDYLLLQSGLPKADTLKP